MNVSTNTAIAPTLPDYALVSTLPGANSVLAPHLFHHRKARYRGLKKNTAQLFSRFGFANLMLAGRQFK